jgi:hypothetical protein
MGLNEKGYVEGQNVIVEYHWLEGQRDRAPALVADFVRRRVSAFLVLGHGRRRLLWIAVTRNPTAEWLARQITEAFPWDMAPKYLIRDNDRTFGSAFKARVRTGGPMGLI